MAGTARSHDNRLFRPAGFFVVLGLASLGGLYSVLFAASHLKHFLESYGSRLNLARVDVGSVSIEWLEARIRLDDIQIADGEHPMRNLAQIDRITVDIATAPLLKRKLIVPLMRAEGIRLGTARKESGLVDLTRESVGPGLLDRATGIYASLRRDVSRNPLRRLAQLSTGLGLDVKLTTQRARLSVLRGLDGARDQLESTIRTWERAVSALPSAEWIAERRKRLQDAPARAVASDRETVAETLRELKKAQDEIGRLRESIRSQGQAVGRRLVELDRLAERDIALLRQSLDLPQFDSGDLTIALFGPRTLNYLERLTYWIDLSRRRMPIGARHGQIGVVQRQAGPGTSYHFGKASALPTFLLERLEFVSQLDGDPSTGRVVGTIEDVTTDPPIWHKPTRISLEAEFPGRKIHGVRFEAMVDHTADVPVEKLAVRIASMPLSGWQLYDGSDLTLELGQATGVLKFEAAFNDASAEMTWKAAAIDIAHRVRSPYRQVEDIVRDALRGATSFELTGRSRGELAKLSFDITSDIGRQLGGALKNRFQHALGAIDDALRNELLDQYDPIRQTLLGQLREAQYRVEQPIEPKLAELQSLIDLAEKRIGRSARRSSLR